MSHGGELHPSRVQYSEDCGQKTRLTAVQQLQHPKCCQCTMSSVFGVEAEAGSRKLASLPPAAAAGHPLRVFPGPGPGAGPGHSTVDQIAGGDDMFTLLYPQLRSCRSALNMNLGLPVSVERECAQPV